MLHRGIFISWAKISLFVIQQSNFWATKKQQGWLLNRLDGRKNEVMWQQTSQRWHFSINNLVFLWINGATWGSSSRSEGVWKQLQILSKTSVFDCHSAQTLNKRCSSENIILLAVVMPAVAPFWISLYKPDRSCRLLVEFSFLSAADINVCGCVTDTKVCCHMLGHEWKQVWRHCVDSNLIDLFWVKA